MLVCSILSFFQESFSLTAPYLSACSFDESDPLGGVQSGSARLSRIADQDDEDLNNLIYGSDDDDSLFDSLPDEPTSPGAYKTWYKTNLQHLVRET